MLTEENLPLIGRRYQRLNLLGSGGMGALYRAVDLLTGQTVALKRVHAGSQKATGTPRSLEVSRIALAREFSLLASLRHPNLITVMDYGFDEDRQPYFTMELQENAQTILQAARGQSISIQVNLLVQMLQALAYVHRQGIVHRDLKPGNVLVKDGMVKVLDFGVSAHRAEVSFTAGTLAYMAPEVWSGQAASPVSDLYSVGVMAYEILAGRRPFASSDVQRLMDDILHAQPEMSHLPSNERLGEVVGRLLEKTPAKRYSDARSVIQALCAAIGQPLPQETAVLRESFLQAAQFVGREAELSRLVETLELSSQGQGGAWLIGGEAGVGKSRLLEELRVHALVKGALTLRGQEVKEGGNPFQVWREILRWPALLAGVTDHEASVLKALVPDIGALLGRHIPDAPELDVTAAQMRLLAAIEELFRRVGQPAVVMLHDLHGSGDESLLVLRRLAQLARERPLMIIGTYRDDERPDLPKSLPEMQLMHLDRLSPGAVAMLSEAMLGPAGRLPQVLDLLRRETEGNAYFVVEVMRALAEEAGTLDQVGARALPAHVFTGGMQQIIRRRLSRVPAEARSLLLHAAAMGRRLDLPTLKILDPKTDQDHWLTVCALAAVLARQDGVWQFSHDRLRDAILASVPEDQRKEVHRRIALALEKVRREEGESAAGLAYHWGRAGDETKEQRYSASAGRRALEIGAYAEAISLLKRALEIEASKPTSRLAQARWERELAEAYYALGQLETSRGHLMRTVSLLQRPLPPSGAGLGLGLVGEALRQLVRRLLPSLLPRKVGAGAEACLEAARAYERLMQIAYFTNETILSGLAGLRSLNLAEMAGGVSPELARAYANVSYAAGLIPLHTLARAYGRRAMQAARNIKDQRSLAWVCFVTGFYAIGIGRWREAEERLRQAIQINASLGDRRRWEESWVVHAHTAFFQGRFDQGTELYAELFRRTTRREEDVQQQVWALDGQAMNLLRLGRMDQAIALLKVAAPLLASCNDRAEEISHHGLLAATRFRLGEKEPALQAAERTANLVARSHPAAPYLLEAYGGVAEVYLSLGEASSKMEESRQLLALSKEACRLLDRFARQFPIGRPRSLLNSGRLAWMGGKRRQAGKAWHRALAEAGAMQMPYEQALAHLEIGRHLPPEDRDRSIHLRQASGIFRRLGADYDYARAEIELGSPSAEEETRGR